MPVGRCGHNFYSMTSDMAGKCAFPMRRKPRRSKILATFEGTREWYGIERIIAELGDGFLLTTDGPTAEGNDCPDALNHHEGPGAGQCAVNG